MKDNYNVGYHDSLKDSYFQRQQDIINIWMTDIDLANSKINEICEKADIDLENIGLLESEILKCEFISQVFKKLSNSLPLQNGTTEQLYTHVPKIQCTKFCGEEVGKFVFKIFLAQVENCVTSIESPKVKLSLLKGFLTGYASQLISNLSLENENYDVAINLLRNYL